MKKLVLVGANRGGMQISKELLCSSPILTKEITIMDAKKEKADRLSRMWKDARVANTVSARRTIFEGEEIHNLPREVGVIMAVDSVFPIIESIVERGKDFALLQWQILASGEEVGGFCGTIVEGEGREDSLLLLRNISPFSRAISSRHIRRSALQAVEINYIRKILSAYSASQIAIFLKGERVSSGLNYAFSGKVYPLKIRKEPSLLNFSEKFALSNQKGIATAYIRTNQVEIIGPGFYTRYGEDEERRTLVTD